MKKIVLSAVLVFGFLPFASPALALNIRSWVSSSGDDANPCSRPQPCATFQRAHDQTNPNGEVDVLDSGDYGYLSITKGISIVNDGAGVVASGNGANVNPGAGADVTLRGLSLGPNSSNAVIIRSGRIVQIQRCLISKANISSASQDANGIMLFNSQPTRLVVSDTEVTSNGTPTTSAGIRILPQAGASAQVAITRVVVSGNTFGIAVDGSQSTAGINMTIIDSFLASNINDGLVATSSPSTAPVGVAISNSASLNNGYGIRSIGSNVTVRVEGSKIIGNGVGLSGGGVLLSAGNNMVQANGTNGSFNGSFGFQ